MYRIELRGKTLTETATAIPARQETGPPVLFFGSSPGGALPFPGVKGMAPPGLEPGTYRL